MQHIDFLFKHSRFAKKPWLIIGKGPSFSSIKEYNTSDFFTFGLNHVVEKTPCLDVSHLIDFDVFEECSEAIYNNSKFLCMPINPHFAMQPSKITLKDLVLENEVLAALAAEKRLFWYNHLSKFNSKTLTRGNFQRVLFKKTKVKYFSAEAAFQILGCNGVKKIYSIGLDGGSSYCSSFCHNSLLKNGKTSFDDQFIEISKTITTYGIDYHPLSTVVEA